MNNSNVEVKGIEPQAFFSHLRPISNYYRTANQEAVSVDITVFSSYSSQWHGNVKRT
jgi:hypothetical protein